MKIHTDSIPIETFEARLNEAVKRDDLSPSEATSIAALRRYANLYSDKLRFRLRVMQQCGIDLVGDMYDRPEPAKKHTARR